MNIALEDFALGIAENISENGWRWLYYLRNSEHKCLKNCIKYYGPNKIFYAGAKYRMDGLTGDGNLIMYSMDSSLPIKMPLKNFISLMLFTAPAEK